MACVELEIKDNLPKSFNCKLYISKMYDKISCTCINLKSFHENTIDIRECEEEYIWETLLDVIASTILESLGKD